MKRIITAHIYNTTLLLFFLGVLGVLSLVAMVTSFFAALGQSVLGWGALVGGAFMFFWGIIISYYTFIKPFWDFIRIVFLFFFGKKAVAGIENHQHKVERRKTKSGTTTTDIYTGNIVFLNQNEEKISIPFYTEEPGAERDAITYENFDLEIWYWQEKPKIACVLWLGETEYKRLVKTALGLLSVFASLFLIMLLAIAKSWDGDAMVLVGMSVFFFPLVAWAAMNIARRRWF